MKDNDIFIFQFLNGNDLSFFNGKIKSFMDNKIIHNASTDDWSSGSPIIRRSKDNSIIGLHYGGVKKNKTEYIFNIRISFDSILDNIIEKNFIIICVYNADNNENVINLLHDYNECLDDWDEEKKKVYLETKKSISEENIEIYVNDKKMKFDFK